MPTVKDRAYLQGRVTASLNPTAAEAIRDVIACYCEERADSGYYWAKWPKSDTGTWMLTSGEEFDPYNAKNALVIEKCDEWFDINVSSDPLNVILSWEGDL